MRKILVSSAFVFAIAGPALSDGAQFDTPQSALDTFVAALEAVQSDVTGPNLLRMTLTQPCVAFARNVLLLITGAEKRQVFETAADDAPVSIMKRAAGGALTVYYCD